MPVYVVKIFKVSEYDGANQIWFNVVAAYCCELNGNYAIETIALPNRFDRQ